ncbi:MAG: helix-turn-helix domain-containing protein [Candidatus Micrarchaeia archaeon]
MASETEVLEELGLTANEARLYLLLVKSGNQKANELAVKSGLQRRTVYDTLASLEKKGLAGKAEVNGVLVFSASPPASLLSLVDEKRDSISKILPSLAQTYEKAGETKVSVLYGISGIKTVFEDVISLQTDYCAYYGQLQFFDMLPKSMGIFNEKRKELGLKARYILLDVPQARERAHLMPLTEIKFMDPSALSVGVWWTYADRVILFVLEKDPATIFIKNAALARTFQKIFDKAFDSQAQVYHGREGMKAILEMTLEFKDTHFIGGFGMAPKLMPEYFENTYNPEAQKKGHKWWNVAHRTILKTPAMKQPFHNIRFLPSHLEKSPNVIWIFGDYVANVVWLKEPVAFLVHDRNIARAYKEYFRLLWDMAEEK